MYWIQEHGVIGGATRANYKMYNCDYKSDIAKLPRIDVYGTQDCGDESKNEYYNAPCDYGDQCLCLEDSTVFELRWAPNDWKQL